MSLYLPNIILRLATIDDFSYVFTCNCIVFIVYISKLGSLTSLSLTAVNVETLSVMTRQKLKAALVPTSANGNEPMVRETRRNIQNITKPVFSMLLQPAHTA